MALNEAQRQTLIDTNLSDDSNIEAVEHREVETALNEALGVVETTILSLQAQVNAVAPINQGTFIGLNVGDTAAGTNYAVSGDIVTAVLQPKTNPTDLNSIVRVSLSNAMPTVSYDVLATIQSGGATLDNDSFQYVASYKVIDVSTFDIVISETANATQTLVVNLKVFIR